MIKKLYSIISLFTTSCMGQANPPAAVDDSWLQKSYDHVIMIENKHVAQAGDNWLVDIPLVESPDSHYVFFLSARIPTALFTTSNTFYPSIKEFTLIVPDWQLYHEIAEEASRKGMCIEPATTNIYYHIRRMDTLVKIDSVRVSGEQPGITFHEPKVPAGNIAVYRSESYGSVCCPKDPKWELEKEDAAVIKSFEQQHKVSVSGTYRQNQGKEGEHTDYYTLPRLTAKQRLDFILMKRSQWIVNKATKKIVFKPQVFTPWLEPFVKEGFREMREVKYDQ
ncbi:hypothetical protein SAMN04488128_105363 [Chitinophaga eiseniae]|uniref:Uncharacterized protein n=1 Tax=Chitinophaga eiseniae TaxID=634771 RepID=A0A1T4TL57_9BACT|nr:hypothetical protein [Chitinophaga eiseniae]SKA41202.1 hypothetical protein SAMN04488128_105363 [Chitinophaga eiseniae]